MERYKSIYSNKEFYTIPETIFDLYKELTHSGNGSDVIGGITSDTKHSWLALGPYLQVFYSKQAKVRSVWCFGAAAKEQRAKVICVQELKAPYHDSTLLVVGLQYGSYTGMVCIYNLSCAKVLRAIEIPQHVTSLHVISSGNDSPFPGPLSALDGIIAVGTSGGGVYLIDLCKELVSEARKLVNVLDIRNESCPCQLRILYKTDIHDLEAHKTAAEQDGTHVAILLNELEVCGADFELKAPTGRSVIFASKKEVDVSTLQYAPQLCSLFVGYNFGALQIWNFLSLGLEYTSPVYEENMPVSFIAVQEPIDDPRAFCYFWAVYSYTCQYHNAFPLAALYSLTFESKDYHEGYGNIYRKLLGCSVRFQANLRMVDTNNCKSAVGANCIRLQSYSKASNAVSSDQVGSSNDEYAVCMMAWNVHCEKHKFHTYLSLFDLNQWYKEQMPNLAYQQRYMNYMTHLCLSEGNASRDYPMLDAQIDPTSISPYFGVNRMEEHYRPSSLAFALHTLTEIEVSHQCNLGAQRGLFKELEEAGPLALMHPEEFYASAKALGLAPLFQDMSADAPTDVQCDILLSIALERKMLKWLCKCATSWGNGSHRSIGLSLELLLNWGWERTRTLKTNVDRCCACLFDYSGTKLDTNVGAIISACRVQFGNLKDLFNFVVKHCDTFLVHPDITRQQLAWLEKNYAYFNVIGWMINMKILPESRQTYPVEEIAGLYRQRRSYLMGLEQQSLGDCTVYLFIDQLTNIESLRAEWRDSDNGNVDGLYPPTTMQTLLRAYFNDALDIKMVHSLVAYAMLDLVMHCPGTQDNRNISATLIKFPQIFDLSMSTTKVIQAFWQFDRGQLEPAMSQLAGRAIHAHDLTVTQHRFIVKVLKLQGQYRLALKYIKARNPKGTKEDVKNLIQLHVRNKMLFEALSIERRHSDDDLLEAFFLECLQSDAIMQLLSINFTRYEELALLKFMDNRNYSYKEEFKAIYFVRRGRFLDFYMRHDKEATKSYAMPSILKNTLDNILPKVTKTVIDTCLELRGLTYEDTKSLSAYVCDPSERAKFNNDFVKACVVNCKSAWKNAEQITEEDFPFVRPPYQRTATGAKTVIYTRGVDKIVPLTSYRENEEGERVEPPPKRMRLEGGLDGDTLNKTTIETYFHRSNVQSPCSNVKLSAATPLSILKTTSYSQRGESTTPEDVGDFRRSLTPKLICRPAIATPTVRFTELHSNVSSANSACIQTPTAQSSNASVTKESTTTDYFSAEMSLEEPSASNRKRKFTSDDSQPEPEEEAPFQDVDPSILRSSFGNVTASKFLESMRKSYVEEALPAGVSLPVDIPMPSFTDNQSYSQPRSQCYLHKAVFVFTGTDAVDTTGLTPKARDTYQTHREGDSRRFSMDALEFPDKETRHDCTSVRTSTSEHVEIVNNVEVHAESKTVVHQQGSSQLRKKDTGHDGHEVMATGEDNVDVMETEDHSLCMKEQCDGDDNTVIDLTVTPSPSLNMKVFQQPGFVDYFSPSYQEQPPLTAIPTKSSKLHSVSKLVTYSLKPEVPKLVIDKSSDQSEVEDVSSRLVDQVMPVKTAKDILKGVKLDFNASSQCKTPNDAPEDDISSKSSAKVQNSQQASYIESLEHALNDKALPKPLKLKFNTTIQTADICSPMDADSTQVSVATPDQSIVTVELVDTPVINESRFERTSFFDYFADTIGEEDSSLELKVDNSVNGVQIVDISDEPQEETEVNAQIEEQQQPEMNVYEDLSNPASASNHYIIDPVMNNYIQPQETDYRAGSSSGQEAMIEERGIETSERNLVFNAETLPPEELFESMDAMGDNNENSREMLNVAVAEIISIGSSSSSVSLESDVEKASRQSSSRFSESDSNSNPAEVAFIEDSESMTNASISNATSKENLDENVNEVKTSSKSESDNTIVTESSVVVKEVMSEQPKEIAEVLAEAPSTPKRQLNRSASSKSDTPALKMQLRPRRSSISLETATGTLVSSTVDVLKTQQRTATPKLGKPALRTRSMSTDTAPTPVKAAARRSLRARSVDVFPGGLNPIVEEAKPSPRRLSRRLSELKELKEAETYKSQESTPENDLLQARRLTRSQKQMMHDRTIDRLRLLDKDDFQGTSDPEEVNLLQRSPPSSIASSSAAENARQVKHLTENAPTTPKRRGRSRKSPTPDTSKMATEESDRTNTNSSRTETSRSVRAGSAESVGSTPRRITRKTMGVIVEEIEETKPSSAKRGRRRSSVASSGSTKSSHNSARSVRPRGSLLLRYKFPNAYINYLTEFIRRPENKQRGLPQQKLFKLAAQKWNQLTPDERTPYRECAEYNKQRNARERLQTANKERRRRRLNPVCSNCGHRYRGLIRGRRKNNQATKKVKRDPTPDASKECSADEMFESESVVSSASSF